MTPLTSAVTKKPPRKARALEIRDAFLQWFPGHERQMPIGNTGETVPYAELGRFSFIYRTPFTRLPKQASPSYQTVLAQQMAPNLPYGLDVCLDYKKVMSLEWNDNDRVRLVSFRPGEWDDEVMKAMAGT